MPVSFDEFVSQLAASGLVPAADLQTIQENLPPPSKRDVAKLAKELLRHHKLSAFQAQMILQGKGRQLVLGNYEVLDRLGEGGMGVVFKAQHRRMKRLVALKLLSDKLTHTPDAVRRFQREVEAAAKLRHPNIVAADDADEAGGVHFLVMEFVEGQDLAAVLKAEGPLPVPTAVAHVVQAARGLHYAHQCGVVHRDIKPANLLLDRTGTVKILDMGLARLESADPQSDMLTGTDQIMGTIDFMAPEQALDTKSADARADIYSLGMTLWNLLTGRMAYDGESVLAKLLAHRDQPIPSLRQACPEASPALVSVFEKMVAKAPELRYQSMAEVIAALSVAAGEAPATPDLVPRAPSLRGNSSPASAPRAGSGARSTPAAAAAGIASEPALTVTLVTPQADTDPHTAQLIENPLNRQPASSKLTSARAPTTLFRAAAPRRRLAVAAFCCAGLLLLVCGGWLVFRRSDLWRQSNAQPSHPSTGPTRDLDPPPIVHVNDDAAESSPRIDHLHSGVMMAWNLLKDVPTQRDLKLSEIQMQELVPLRIEFDEGLLNLLHAGLPNDEHRVREFELQSVSWSKLQGVLTAPQISRLSQLAFAELLPEAYMDQEFVRWLSLDDGQLERVRAICLEEADRIKQDTQAIQSELERRQYLQSQVRQRVILEGKIRAQLTEEQVQRFNGFLSSH